MRLDYIDDIEAQNEMHQCRERNNFFIRTLWKSETVEIVNSNSEGEKGQLGKKEEETTLRIITVDYRMAKSIAVKMI